ncbi:hypothetical protein EPA93_25705 [Ktedonosporobacter rubrisoli]|uniref:Uncharacterized protein n=1 Tax=Ktedonosporobacter rubrisoli TaxID=2509675 RepID=A0A4P6JV34_KTERU|nr:IPT/TIG domain-containing protein [Ktedonosporobacter rubrisoli]QBD79190.1 hypothetical protein EPA93_25705 [Ktedonosporobacter rubrisoli]
MFKRYAAYFFILFCCVAGSILFIAPAPVARAAQDAQVLITSPLINNVAVGHPGTKIQIKGTNFADDGDARLYTTPNPEKCSSGSGLSSSLKPLDTNPDVQITNGEFQVDTTWPTNAATPSTPYYICVVGPGDGNGHKAVSMNTFTVAQPVSLNVSPSTAAPGDQVTITGANWLPPQQVNVTVGNGTNAAITQSVNSDNNGNFSMTITIPAGLQAQTYTVQASAANEQGTQASQNITIGQSTATPTAAASPTVAASPTPNMADATATATASSNSSASSSGGPSSLLLFVLGGAGVLLVIIGLILFVVYSRSR